VHDLKMTSINGWREYITLSLFQNNRMVYVHWSMFTCLISRIFSVRQQCFFYSKSVLSVITFQTSEQSVHIANYIIAPINLMQSNVIVSLHANNHSRVLFFFWSSNFHIKNSFIISNLWIYAWSIKCRQKQKLITWFIYKFARQIF